MAEQQPLLRMEQDAEQGPDLAAPAAAAAASPRLRKVNRKQIFWGEVCLEDLIPADHVARAIWELSEKLDVSEFLKENRSVEGKQGRNRWDPQLLLSLWVYSYSQGIGAAREIERQMEYEPGLRWLMGNEKVNYHTLSDFRVGYGEALEKLFVDLLGLLSQQGMVNLAEVTQDGTRVRAVAGGSSLRRERTLREHLKEAEELVEKLGKETAEEAERRRTKKEAAQRRAAQERKERLKQALEELEQIRKSGKNKKEPEEARASESEPEARVMKDGHGGFGPSYNVQATVETSHGIVVSVGIAQESNDLGQLEPAVERMEQQLGQKPGRVIADAGYSKTEGIEAMVGRGVELIGPPEDVDKLVERNRRQSLKVAGIEAAFGQQYFVVIEEGGAVQCPAGKRMKRIQKREQGVVEYRASEQDCGGCANKARCCPKSKARTVKIRTERTVAEEHRERMRSEEAKAIYRKRGQVAEFPFAWIKEKLKLRKFHVRGLAKAGMEALWVVLTYNIQQWVRLRWRAAMTPTGA
jgi:transposase